MDKPRIAYIYPRSATFVKKDIRLLSESFHVVEFDGKVMGAASLLSLFFRQFFFLIFHPRCKVYVCMFAGYHALLPGIIARLFGKKMLIISGGADAVSFPLLGYGNFRKNPLAWASAKSFRLSHHVAPVSEALIMQDSPFQREYGKQGYKHFVKNLKTPSTVIPNGYDANYWKSTGEERDKQLFLTVATHVETEARRKIKGLDLFIESARKLPQLRFMIVGCSRAHLGAIPANITVIEGVDSSELVKIYSKASYYVQLSSSEGFPNALCEAMLCGCVPIVSSVGAMPEIVGLSGYILEEKNIDRAANLMQQAITNSESNRSTAARERVAKNYTEEKRKSALTALIQYLIKRK